MPTIQEIRAAGTSIAVPNNPIVEPLSPPSLFKERLKRFGEHYNLNPESHLYRFLEALMGDSGAGMLKRELLYPKLQQALESTHFTDLDLVYGNILGLRRLSDEVYNMDPRNEILTSAQWQEVKAKDAQYRSRCLTWMRALILGPTKQGIALAAEAALGAEASIFEQYIYLDNQDADIPITLPNLGVTSSRNEFIIMPQLPNLTQYEHHQVIKLVDKLRPVNTIVSVTSGDYIRNERPVREVASSSDYFNVKRLVTGRPDVTWPEVDPALGYWITSEEQEAPTFAFMDRQESVTYLTVSDAVASTEHVGLFNKMQSDLFRHLKDVKSNYYFKASKSFATAAPYSMSSPWTYGYNETSRLILVNNHYPVGYFSDPLVSQLLDPGLPPFFWASNEELAPAQESLVFDFGRSRPFNAISFELTSKPVSFTIEYDDNGVWLPLESAENIDNPSYEVTYLANPQPWLHLEYHFSLVQTRYIRITFTRKDIAWPLPDSDPFKWSIEVRNTRLMHIMTNADDYVADIGTDILGNSYRTDLEVLDATHLVDDNELTIWQSQPNPSRQAVECVYFDLRTNFIPGTQYNLDNSTQRDLEGRPQADMENYYSEGVVFDEIFVDPVTLGPTMHVYVSDDDEGDWDFKLWRPIPRHYVVKRGNHILPRPVKTKFVKLEFSNLVPAPYTPIEFASISPIRYRKFPSWVQDYFFGLQDNRKIQSYDIVDIDPVKFGFQRDTDALDSSIETMRSQSDVEQNQQELQSVLEAFNISLGIGDTNTAQDQLESQIDLRPSFMWQEDLIAQLDTTRALSRVAKQGESNWNVETLSPISALPAFQSGIDMSQARIEKFFPVMWFPRQCRHEYLVVEAERPGQIAYFIALRDVKFLRRDSSIVFDQEFYTETFEDDDQTESNEFEQDDWKYVVTP